MRKFVFALLLPLFLSACVSTPRSAPAPERSPDFLALHALLGAYEKSGSRSPEARRDDYRALRESYASRPDFPCQQPAWAAWFRDQGELPAQLSMVCPDRLPVLMRDGPMGWQVRWLDSQRVRAIHLLFADKSPAMASRFGHVALRLIVCPDRESARAASSEACDVHVEEQVVLGFQAYVDDSRISLRRAIFGGYQTRLVAQPFMEVYEQYASAEFRDVYSLPLRMTSQEQSDFLKALVQVHWSHESDYRFFSANCATLLQDTLSVFWPRYRQTKAMQQHFLRPDRFFQAMQANGLVDVASLQAQGLARRGGYFFASNEAAYRDAAHMVAAAMEQPFFTSLDDYLEVAAASRRAALAGDAGLGAASRDDPRLQDAPLVLEEWAMLRAERRVLQASQALWEMKRGRLRYRGDVALSAEEETLMDDCLLLPLQALFSPPGLQNGIPLAASAETSAAKACNAAQRARFQQLLNKELQHASAGWQQLMMAISELAETLASVQALRRSMPEHQNQGGNESDLV